MLLALIITITAAATLLGCCAAVDAVDRIRDTDPLGVLSTVVTAVCAAAAAGGVVIILQMLEATRWLP